jgi:hypothetical protein
MVEVFLGPLHFWELLCYDLGYFYSKRSQVQGSTFRVRDKDKNEAPKPS